MEHTALTLLATETMVRFLASAAVAQSAKPLTRS